MTVISRQRRHLLKGAGGALLLGPTGLAQAGAAAVSKLSGYRMAQQRNVMLHFDLDSPVDGVQVFTLDSPDRLVIDLPDTAVEASVVPVQYEAGAVRGVRYGVRDGNDLRIVIDLRSPVDPAWRFVERSGGQRMLVDLGIKGDPGLAGSGYTREEPAVLRDVVVAIDAGHGGKDPGAIGQRQTREKDVVLQVARRLFRQLAAQPGITPVMIRDSDVYVELRDRLRIARERKADLFVSIHADAFMREAAHGSSVYTLSLDGATSEAAAWLANSENQSAALYGDLSLSGMEAGLAETLLDLAQNNSLESSMDIGSEVLGRLKSVGPVHKADVEQANFAVLKSPDMPSILVETAFISNLEEEKKLNNSSYQQSLAEAIGRGITSYLIRQAPQGTLLAEQRRLRN